MKKKKKLSNEEVFIILERKRRRADTIVYWLPTLLGIFWMAESVLCSFAGAPHDEVILYNILGSLWVLIGTVSSLRSR